MVSRPLQALWQDSTFTAVLGYAGRAFGEHNRVLWRFQGALVRTLLRLSR